MTTRGYMTALANEKPDTDEYVLFGNSKFYYKSGYFLGQWHKNKPWDVHRGIFVQATHWMKLLNMGCDRLDDDRSDGNQDNDDIAFGPPPEPTPKAPHGKCAHCGEPTLSPTMTWVDGKPSFKPAPTECCKCKGKIPLGG